MSELSRRAFIAATAAAAGSLLAPRSARAADARIEILVDEPIGRIAPEVHGHFAEHLGGVVYDGIWVGEGSKVPNIGARVATGTGSGTRAGAGADACFGAEEWSDSDRHTSSTVAAPTGFWSAANPLTSALSQITLITRGMPLECW